MDTLQDIPTAARLRELAAHVEKRPRQPADTAARLHVTDGKRKHIGWRTPALTVRPRAEEEVS